MKRIMYIANIRLPTEKAHGIQIMKTCEALAERGIEVELVVPKRKNKITTDPFEFYTVKRKFKITTLWCLDFVSSNRLGKLGFWLETLTFYLSVRTYMRQTKSALYYTRDLAIAFWLSKKNSEVYYEIHTLPEQASSNYRETWNNSKKIIVISEGLRKGLENFGIAKEKILVAPDSVEPDQFDITATREECREKLQIVLDEKVVVYTGHLYAWKGADTCAEAAKYITDPHIHIYFVGGTEADVALFRSKYGRERIHILGWRPHEEVPFWLKAADALVIPNSLHTKIGSLYTSPLKLFEYMCSGTPIVASRVPALEEVVNEKEVCFFTPDSPESLAHAVERVVNQESAVWKQAAQKLVARARDEYSWNKRGEIIAQFLFDTAN